MKVIVQEVPPPPPPPEQEVTIRLSLREAAAVSALLANTITWTDAGNVGAVARDLYDLLSSHVWRHPDEGVFLEEVSHAMVLEHSRWMNK